ncbi:hypothetical protein BJ508DRAFT_414742 [Ascobolus immersus RN42]|uniref:C2H2-type domain-containing protein n=1 Tax=Ascobolus immersus RN42 TaxID=1160509 RepID=A0A3N4I5Z6_ASCIM|nr:hypothetical protein BJ508DRAFT_414742 [Ascobolus immersus RN42]
MEDDFPQRSNSTRKDPGLIRIDSTSGRSIHDQDAGYINGNHGTPNGGSPGTPGTPGTHGTSGSGSGGGQQLWKKVMKRLKTVRHMEGDHDDYDERENRKIRDGRDPNERYSFDYPTGGRSSPSCDSFLDSQQELAIHRCSYCNRPFRTEALLAKHCDKHHYPGAPPVSNYASQSGLVDGMGESSAGGGVSRAGADSVLVDHNQPNYVIAEGGDLILDVMAPFAAPSAGFAAGEGSPESRRNSIFSTSGAVNGGGDGSSQFNGIGAALSPTEPAEAIRSTFLVSSQVLSTASPVFAELVKKTFLLPPRRRLQPSATSSANKLTLTPAAGKLTLEEDPRTFFLVLNILHHRNSLLPKKLPFPTLVSIALIADRYSIAEPLQLWVERWSSPYRKLVREPSYHDWLIIAWTFSYDDIFRTITHELSLSTSFDPSTSRLLVEAPGQPPKHLAGYNTAPMVLERLAAVRQSRIQPLMHYLISHKNGRIKNGYGPNWFCRTPVKKDLGNSCDAFQLGHLLLSLSTHNLDEGSPFWEKSVRDIVEGLDKIEIQSIDFSRAVECKCQREPKEGEEVKHTTCAIAHRACSWVPGLKEQIRLALDGDLALSLEEFKREIAASKEGRPSSAGGSTIKGGESGRDRRERERSERERGERPGTSASQHTIDRKERDRPGTSSSSSYREDGSRRRRREGSVSGSVRKERRERGDRGDRGHRRAESEGVIV